MAGKKITAQDIAGNTDVFSDLMNAGKENKTVSVQKTEPITNKETEKDVHLTMLVKESTRKAWKQFFIDHDLNTTQGIEIAMLHLIDDVKSGNYKLNKGGLIKIQNTNDY